MYQEHKTPDHVHLLLRPTEKTTWGDWVGMTGGLMEFMSQYETLALGFEAIYVGPPRPGEVFGGGELYATDPDGSMGGKVV